MAIPGDLNEQAVGPHADAVLRRSRRRIELFVEAGDDWRFAESLKSVSEDTAQEYQGRALFELLQNGYDALAPKERHGRLLVLLDAQAGPHGTLYFANEGAPFSESNFKAITEFGLSNKGAGEGIGNKGLGFRSVLQLTDWPEIYSKRRPDEDTFGGYCFRFATPSDIRDLVLDEQLAREVAEKVSALALPVPAHVTDRRVANLGRDGYVTVVRLPLRNSRATEAAREQLEAIADHDAPLLLFLERLSALEIRYHGAEDSWDRVLDRSQRPFPALRDDSWITEIDLGDQGQYLHAVRRISSAAMREAIESSISAREIDENWRDWDGEATVALALGLDQPIEVARLYTFLPMSDLARSPFSGHVHAPFFTKLARLDISESVVLNRFLLDEVATLTKDVVGRLVTLERNEAPLGLTIDAACWEPPDRLDRAYAAVGEALTHNLFVPVLGRPGWAALEASYQWSAGITARVVTAEGLTSLGVSIVDPELTPHQRARLERLHEDLLGRSMEPDLDEAACWVERLAGSLDPPHDAGLEQWANFYDDLALIFGNDTEALAGRSIIIDQDGRVTRALGSGSTDTTARQTIFFAPDEDATDSAESRLPRDLRALRRQITFTHPDLPWNVPGNPPRKRPGRTFLEPQLVREYRTDRVFDALEELLRHHQTEAFRRDALLFAYRQFSSLNESQRARLARCGFYVPTANGTWRPAHESLFHPRWRTEGAMRLEQFLASGGETIREFARLKDRWIAAPDNWPDVVQDTSEWQDFLRSLGVRDGLLVFAQGFRMSERDGAALRPEALAVQFKLDADLASIWPALVRENWTDFAHPWTKYSFDQPLSYLPGAASVEGLGSRARQQFAELILLGLASWGDHCFAVRVRRPTRPHAQQDPHIWPTPLAAQLRSLQWLPVTDDAAPDGIRFVEPSRAWYATEGELPAFMPALPSTVRKLLLDESALRRSTDAGLRVWEESRNGPELVRELGELLDAGLVPAHMTVHFKKHYQRGWADTLQMGRWPWSPGEDVRLAVTESSALAVIGLEHSELLFLPDEDNQLKESLLELAGFPVLISPTDYGPALGQFLAANGVEVVGFSETEVQIQADGQLVIPTAELPLLTSDADWMSTVVGLVLELKSGEFRRRTERAVRELLHRLRSIRIVRATDVDILIEGLPAEHPPSMRSLPVDDERLPTIVVWSSEPGWPEWRAASSAICQLLHQPALQPALELALIKLEARLGGEPPDRMADEDLAHALDTTAHKVAELRRGLTGEVVELVYRLRPVLGCILGLDRIDEVDNAVSRAADEDALRFALHAWQGEMELDVDALIATAKEASSVADLRDEVGLDFFAFNEVLVGLGAPYSPIVHPDRHEQAFRAFIDANAEGITDCLRERYAALAASGEDVSGYVEARRHEGLDPDPKWLLRYEAPPSAVMRRRVGEWLESHDARSDFEAGTEMPPLDKMRSANFERLGDVVSALGARVAAWCRVHGQVVPPAWLGVPVIAASGRLEGEGIADLVIIDERTLVQLCADALGWPTGMPVTLDLDALGLRSEDLSEKPADDPSRSAPNRPPATIRIGGKSLAVGTGHLAELAQAAYETIDEDFLTQTGRASFGDVPAPPGKRRGSRGGQIVVARMSGMTDDQRSAVGLIGEVAARAWLGRRYQGVRWRSGYAAIVEGDEEASDSWGYDFEVPHRNSSLFFEVKSIVDEPRDLTEFEMGDSEVRVAQDCAGGDRYRILLVTSVLEPEARRVFDLSSPFSRKGVGRFRVIGRGLRYQCALNTGK
jgi:hypothetical protein